MAIMLAELKMDEMTERRKREGSTINARMVNHLLKRMLSGR
jgi:hypothetical protein